MPKVAETGQTPLALGIELGQTAATGEEAPKVLVLDRYLMADPADAIAIRADRGLLAAVQGDGGRDSAVVSPGDA